VTSSPIRTPRPAAAGLDHHGHRHHIHGAGRSLVLARDGVSEPKLVWKDTVLVRSGEVIAILFDIANPRPVDGPLPHR
jgi:FtsP/CotA-like multicopper oxidase with cupredoxin domain